MTKLHGLDVYVASPAPDPTGNSAIRGIIIIIPDAFGWEFVNNRILADHYAQKGRYKVYLPDFMNGENQSIQHVVWCWYDEDLDLTLCSPE